MNILISGGLGFIGSHTVVELLNNGHEIVIIDNLHNSQEDVYKKIENITKKMYSFIRVMLLIMLKYQRFATYISLML